MSESASMMVAIIGLIAMPPSDSPDDAIDRAMERFRTNQRVTIVELGTRLVKAKPVPKTTITRTI